ncbi:Ig-like domain-containing protein [uncultured Cellulomonas sp.]|uniref:Ig-like domain-containing protein n=1 Tax=uncultured Cellulomonas sp. TaxID=189682 RepID=UPI0026251E53|nr:Ig-like domain-containing protein [uncultured Cellulomonas sp.]
MSTDQHPAAWLRRAVAVLAVTAAAGGGGLCAALPAWAGADPVAEQSAPPVADPAAPGPPTTPDISPPVVTLLPDDRLAAVSPAAGGPTGSPTLVAPQADVLLTAPDAAVPGARVVVVVTVVGNGATPGGTVEVVATSGDEVRATTTALADGRASAAFESLPAGTWTVEASYLGEADAGGYPPARSAPHVLVVAAPAPQAVTLTAAPVTVTVGTPAHLLVFLSGWGDKPSVTVREGDSPLGSGTPTVSFPARVDLPVLSPGTHTLVVESAADERFLAATTTVVVTVVGEPPRSSPTPGSPLAASLTGPAASGTVTLVGGGVRGGETVAYFLYPGGVLLGTAVADADGGHRLSVPLPPGTAAGAYSVVAIGGSSGQWGEVAITVTAPPAVPRPAGREMSTVGAPARGAVGTASPATHLAASGADLRSIAALTAALVAGGGALLALGRRPVSASRRTDVRPGRHGGHEAGGR